MTPTWYVIWSMEHQAWWRPGRMGYSETLDGAGIYSYDAAQRIVTQANLVECHEAMIPVAALRRRDSAR